MIQSSRYADSGHPNRALNLLIELSSHNINVERSVYTFLMVMGDIGGFVETIGWIALFLIGNYTHRLFISKILNQSFKIKSDVFSKDLNQRAVKKEAYKKYKKELISKGKRPVNFKQEKENLDNPYSMDM